MLRGCARLSIDYWPFHSQIHVIANLGVGMYNKKKLREKIKCYPILKVILLTS